MDMRMGEYRGPSRSRPQRTVDSSTIVYAVCGMRMHNAQAQGLGFIPLLLATWPELITSNEDEE
eukprot:scaffold13863_cov35-Tisochrysis_lutea.AAC.4